MTLTLPEVLAIQVADELKNTWLAALDADQTSNAIALDGAGVTKVDGTGMALLIALIAEFAKRQRSWGWTELSPVIEDAAADMGVAQQLQPSS